MQDCDGKLLKSMDLKLVEIYKRQSILKSFNKLFMCRLQPKQLTDFCFQFVNGTCKMSRIFDKIFKIMAF